MEAMEETNNAVPPVTAKMTLVPCRDEGRRIAELALTQPLPTVINLSGEHFDIGRGANSKKAIHSLQVSRKHCVFEYKEFKWWIRDTSTNGVYLNGYRVGKGISREISEKDLIRLLPDDLLCYQFEYVTAPAPSAAPNPPEVPVAPLIDFSEDDNVSVHSESLLSLENVDDLVLVTSTSTGFDINVDEPELTNQNHLEDLPEVRHTNPPARDTKASKRNADVLRPHNQISNKGKGDSGKRNGDAPELPFIDVEDENMEKEEDELLDFEYDDIKNFYPQRKMLKTDEDDPVVVPGSPLRPVSNPSTSTPICSPPKKEIKPPEGDDVDYEVMKTQLKYFIQNNLELKKQNKLLVLTHKLELEEIKGENRVLVLSHRMQNDQLKEKLEQVETEMMSSKKQGLQDLLSLIDTELNCCICNEIYIQATVIDCGHTFCNHCITEWCVKKKDCPVCRTNISTMSKEIELNNFLIKIHTLLPMEIQLKRDSLLKERATEVTVAQAVKEAEQNERAEATGARRGRPPGVPAANQALGYALRTPRQRRGGAAAAAAIVPDPIVPPPAPAAAAAAAAAPPDLITLDDSQDLGGGRVPAVLQNPGPVNAVAGNLWNFFQTAAGRRLIG